MFLWVGPCSVWIVFVSTLAPYKHCCLSLMLFHWVTVATGYVQINGTKWARKGSEEEVCKLVNMFTMQKLHMFYCRTKYHSTHLLGLKDTQFIWWVTLNINTTLFVNKKTPQGIFKSKVKDAAFIIYSFTMLQCEQVAVQDRNVLLFW